MNQDTTRKRKRKKLTLQELIHGDYTLLGTPEEVEQRFFDFLICSCDYVKICLVKILVADHELVLEYGGSDYSNIEAIIEKRPDHISVGVSTHDLIQYDYELGHMLLRFPIVLVQIFEQAAYKVFHHILEHTLRRLHSYALDPQNRPDMYYRVLAIQKVYHKHNFQLHVRICNLPPGHENCKPSISCIQASDIGKVIQISGTVVRVYKNKMLESRRFYRCKSCDEECHEDAQLYMCNNALPRPTVCDHCQGNSFEHIQGKVIYTDYQEIKIQESAASLTTVGAVPKSMLCKLTEDLVDSCNPGDEVFVVGQLLPQWPDLKPNVDNPITMALKVDSINVLNSNSDALVWRNSASNGIGSGSYDGGYENYKKEFDEYWKENTDYPIYARNFICSAVCPNLYGLLNIKLGLLLTLIGGATTSQIDSWLDKELANPEYKEEANMEVDDEESDDDEEEQPEQLIINRDMARNNEHPSSQNIHSSQVSESLRRRKQSNKSSAVVTKRRAESHILLVGDPGTGKSQLLKFAAELSPRSVFTSGAGTTSAGLTCSAVREGNSTEFTLEAGALVLADRGVCCIDEFACMKKDDRKSILEAMEQQTLSVAKGGHCCKLNTRATVVAVMNPKDSMYNPEKDLQYNINLSPPLLSRFDIVFLMIDNPNRIKNKEDTSVPNSAPGDEPEDEDDIRIEKIAEFLLKRGIGETKDSGKDQRMNEIGLDCTRSWSMEKLRAYIATVKEKFYPSLTAAASEVIKKYWKECKDHSGLLITARFLEGLIRLSQAHARLMYRNKVEEEDAVAVVLLMKSTVASMTQSEFSQNSMEVQSKFLENLMKVGFEGVDKDVQRDFNLRKRHLLKQFGLLSVKFDSNVVKWFYSTKECDESWYEKGQLD
eukprot:CAMPEP_0178940042 /NCGR_PEP_ID=MMETSP0789-20121207/571_1 /TAXON_ID=3005 /ORGANISM="Rhizosolenia setigera, Strain CCMP 1694" /LENGTH=882 /DNA_ID=CAMNT_0020619001 /DNA_START=453 /DNA_END=3101 /DNA_ORIENTATION=-